MRNVRRLIARLVMAIAIGVPTFLLAQATATTNEGTGGGFWSNIISFIIGIILPFIVQTLKPEWFGEWLTKLIESKMERKNANIVTNSLGFLWGRLSVFFFKADPNDNDLIKQGVQKMEEGLELIKKGLASSKQ